LGNRTPLESIPFKFDDKESINSIDEDKIGSTHSRRWLSLKLIKRLVQKHLWVRPQHVFHFPFCHDLQRLPVTALQDREAIWGLLFC